MAALTRRLPQIGVEHAPIGAHALRIALEDDAPLRHDDDRAADPHDHVHVVLDDEERHAAGVQRQDLLDQQLKQGRD